MFSDNEEMLDTEEVCKSDSEKVDEVDEEMAMVNLDNKWLFPRPSQSLGTVLRPGRVRPLSPTLKVHSPEDVFPGTAVLCDGFDDMKEWKETIEFVGFFAKMGNMFNNRHHWEMRTKFHDVRVRCMDKIVENSPESSTTAEGGLFVRVPEKALEEGEENVAADADREDRVRNEHGINSDVCVEMNDSTKEEHRDSAEGEVKVSNNQKDVEIELGSNVDNSFGGSIEGQDVLNNVSRKENDEASNEMISFKEKAVVAGSNITRSKSLSWFIPESPAWFIPLDDWWKVKGQPSKRRAKSACCATAANKIRGKGDTDLQDYWKEQMSKENLANASLVRKEYIYKVKIPLSINSNSRGTSQSDSSTTRLRLYLLRTPLINTLLRRRAVQK